MAQIQRDYGREADMAQAYKAGETLSGIGGRYGVSRERVRQILARSGLTLRPRGRRKDGPPPSEEARDAA